VLWGHVLSAQIASPPEVVVGPPPPPGALNGVTRPAAPPIGEWDFYFLHQEIEGPLIKLRGNARVQDGHMVFQADEIDWNRDTHEIEARGHAYYQNFDRNERIWCDSLKYDTEEQTGRFENPVGITQPRIIARPHVLTSTSPYYYQGQWAERHGAKFILYKGWITNCKVPNPWWIMRSPKIDIIPGDRAITYRTLFRLKGVPLFYTPYFYHSLEKVPRKSGFLRPTIGNSSTLGRMVELGYFWAINRSYDATYRFADFTDRGFGHHMDFRGKPTAHSDFDAIIYGVQDRGLKRDNGTVDEASGFSVNVQGKADLGNGYFVRGQIDYLNSFKFRQSFTQSFNEAIGSESNSVLFLTKSWSAYSFNAVFERRENFQSPAPGDAIVIRKLPEVELAGRDQQPWSRFPIWISFDSAAGLLQRTQPLFQTRAFTPRLDFQPRVMTALHWKGIHLIPSFSIRETAYGESQAKGQILSKDLNRFSREFSLDLILPTLARTFDKKTFLGDKLKHVIEPRASFLYVGGVSDFNNIIRFDQTDLVTNTKEVDISLTNRLYAKRGDEVTEVLTWQLFQRRYFDPTFGGALVPGARNVFMSTIDVSAFPFLDAARSTSPIVSLLRTSPKNGFGFQWQADYDPHHGGLTDSGFDADVRFSKYFLSAGHNLVRGNPVLRPNANQFRGQAGFGNENRRGWNFGFTAVYDYRVGQMQFATTQVNYNTDCCGFSVQYRRFSFGSRNENQFQVAFSVANLGSFGTLKKQERMF
jgi:LPS-assembly protein